MKHLYFVRHGESELGVLGLRAGHTDTALSAEGRRQAKQAGQQAKKLKIDYIISSPLSRALDTAKIIATEIGYPLDKIEINPLFIERDYGPYEKAPYVPSNGLEYDAIEGVEKSDDLIKRARKALDYLETLPADNILVASHASIGRGIRHHILEDFPFHKYHKLENAQIVQWI